MTQDVLNTGSVVQPSPAVKLGEGQMQRDMDLVRSILLAIDEATQPLSLSELQVNLGQPDEAVLVKHLTMLTDQAGFVGGIAAHTNNGYHWLDLDLTWQGHEFLDSIRDPDIWQRTKAGAAKIGSGTIDVMFTVAKAIIQERMQTLISRGLDN